MAPDLQPRLPGGALPEPVRDAAVRAGRRRRPPDPLLLQRVRDALAQLPESATDQHYLEVLGDRLAFARRHQDAGTASAAAPTTGSLG